MWRYEGVLPSRWTQGIIEIGCCPHIIAIANRKISPFALIYLQKAAAHTQPQQQKQQLGAPEGLHCNPQDCQN